MNDIFARPAPAVGGGETYPANFQLVGRLLIFWVIGYQEGVESQFTQKDSNGNEVPIRQNRAIAHTAVLDGDPIIGKVDYNTRQPGEPFPFPFTAPIEFEGMLWSQSLIAPALKVELNTGKPILARLVYGPKRGQNSPPMKLEDPTPADVQLGMQYLQNRDQIKAYWAQRFEVAGVMYNGGFGQPPAPGPQGAPLPGAWNQPAPQGQFDFRSMQYPQQAPAQVPQWQPQLAAGVGVPVQDQPTYGTPPAQPYQHPSNQGAPQNWDQAAPVQDQPWNPYQAQIPRATEQTTWAQPQPVTEQTEHPAWAPTPDGPPPGWGTSAQ